VKPFWSHDIHTVVQEINDSVTVPRSLQYSLTPKAKTIVSVYLEELYTHFAQIEILFQVGYLVNSSCVYGNFCYSLLSNT